MRSRTSNLDQRTCQRQQPTPWAETYMRKAIEAQTLHNFCPLPARRHNISLSKQNSMNEEITMLNSPQYDDL
jgi:hypothetical protein